MPGVRLTEEFHEQANKHSCIDDCASPLTTLKAMLEDRGYNVWTARNLADGQRIAECLDFEAVVVAQRLASLGRLLSRKNSEVKTP